MKLIVQTCNGYLCRFIIGNSTVCIFSDGGSLWEKNSSQATSRSKSFQEKSKKWSSTGAFSSAKKSKGICYTTCKEGIESCPKVIVGLLVINVHKMLITRHSQKVSFFLFVQDTQVHLSGLSAIYHKEDESMSGLFCLFLTFYSLAQIEIYRMVNKQTLAIVCLTLLCFCSF